MVNKKEIFLFVLSIVGAFLLLLAGAWSSPTFQEQQSYFEAIIVFGSLLFIFSVVVIVAAMGFRSFALFMALFIAMVISLYGIKAGVMVVVMTYILWGFVFALQLLLVNSGSRRSLVWFKERYRYRSFYIEYRVFYPMLWIFYILFELIPHYFGGSKLYRLYPKNLLKQMKKELK